ncbi:hypothetical protein H4P12_08825 [Paracoccus sp. 11-3]|uniref:Uncharacterized protein n=1 Tax=Paracoccus amoyensis TaxID=2760093 RepID=A0A926GGA8_9RHOB|nr:hypothetical protein [Paracoccus amoyensis]MBC9246814.1 hypothetical protein [Paracoccus amoyensis]
MIGARDWRRGWTQATGASVFVHIAVAAALIWQPDFSRNVPPVNPLGELRIDMANLNPTATVTETLTSIVTPEISDDPDSKIDTIRGNLAEDVLTSVQPDELTISGNLPMSTLPDTSRASGEGGAAALSATQTEAPPTDPRITELFDRIRQRLTEPCLLALPALLGDDQIQLGILAADDRQISDLMQDLTSDLDTQIQERAVLLDRRQCAGLTFARRDPSYPVPSLSLQLDAQEVDSGGNLSGRISGSAGLYTTLLLIDDNGVVHDLRRFLVGSATGSRFQIPVARSGQPRDTHQLILAIATAQRPGSVASTAGEMADDFFAALSRDVGQRPRIGVASIYIR